MLFSKRYIPRANWHQAQGETWGNLGVYGISTKAVTWRMAKPWEPEGGFSYCTYPTRFVYVLADDEGRITRWYREFWLNYRKFRMKFPNDPVPPKLKTEEGNPTPSETLKAHFIHCVYQRDDYDMKSIDQRRLPWSSNYLCVDDAIYIGEEKGFIANPYITGRTETTAGDPYGEAPAEQAFTALASLSATKKSTIKAGHLAIEPAILAHDEGVLSGRVDIRPRAVNYGAIDKEGRELVRPFNPNANFQVAKEIGEGDRFDAEESFLVSLFRILEKNERMTTAEVYERLTLQSSLIAPTMGRLQSEDQGPQIEREVALLYENGKIKNIPPELVEARGEYQITYTSPLAMAMYSEEVAGFYRWSGQAVEYMQATGDASGMDWIEWDEAMPGTAKRTNVPPTWVASREKVEEKRQAREQAAQQEAMVKAAPAMASVATAAMKGQKAA